MLRSTIFLLLSLPLAIWSLFDRGAAQSRAASRLLSHEPTPSRVRAMAAVPLDVLALMVVGYLWIGVVVNLAYPARPLFGMSGAYHDSWGGPTLAGAWAVHAAGGVVFLIVLFWLLRGYVALWRRIVPA